MKLTLLRSNILPIFLILLFTQSFPSFANSQSIIADGDSLEDMSSYTVTGFVWIGEGDYLDENNWTASFTGGPAAYPNFPVGFGPSVEYVNGIFIDYFGSGSDAVLSQDFATSKVTMRTGYGNTLIVENSNFQVSEAIIGKTPGEHPNGTLPPPTFSGDPDLNYAELILKNSTVTGNITIGEDSHGILRISGTDDSTIEDKAISTIIGDLNFALYENSVGELIIDSDAHLVLSKEMNTNTLGNFISSIGGVFELKDNIDSNGSDEGLKKFTVENGGSLILSEATYISANSPGSSIIDILHGGELLKSGNSTSSISWEIQNNGEISVQEGSKLYINNGFEGLGDTQVTTGDSGNITFGGVSYLTNNAALSFDSGSIGIAGLDSEGQYSLTLYGDYTVDRHGDGKGSDVELRGIIHNAGQATLIDDVESTGYYSTWRNLENSSLIIEDGSFSMNLNSQGLLINDEGAIVTVAEGVSSFINWDFQNGGNISVREGSVLHIQGGFEGLGDTNITAGDSGHIEFAGSNHLTGDAALSFNGGSIGLRGVDSEGQYSLTLYGDYTVDKYGDGKGSNVELRGIIHNAGRATLIDDVESTGYYSTWRNLENSSLTIEDGGFSMNLNSQGQLINDEGAIVAVAGGVVSNITWDIQNSGSIHLETESSLYTSGDFVNYGKLVISEGAKLNSSNELSSSGLIVIDLEASLSGDLISQNGGEFKVNGLLEADEVNIYDGVLSGSGVIDSNVYLYGGSVSPGNSPGTLQILGDLALGDNSEVNLEIAGLEDGLFDQLFIGGNLYLGDDVLFNISLLDNFMIMEGDTFDLLTITGDVFGDFSSIILNISSNYTFDFLTYFESGMFYLEILSDGVLIENPTANVSEPRVTLMMLLSVLLLLLKTSLRKEN